MCTNLILIGRPWANCSSLMWRSRQYDGHFKPMHRKHLWPIYITFSLFSECNFFHFLWGDFEVPSYNCEFIYICFSSLAFGSCILGFYCLVHMHPDSYNFLVDQKFYHYIVPLFISSNFLCYEIYLSDISIATTTF